VEDKKIPKMVLNGIFHNTRLVGKPRKRCEDVVRRDSTQILGILGWRRRTEGREERRRLVKAARAQKWLWRHRRMDGRMEPS
jgi:hypothetical protein